jgi:hypothetical protein
MQIVNAEIQDGTGGRVLKITTAHCADSQLSTRTFWVFAELHQLYLVSDELADSFIEGARNGIE